MFRRIASNRPAGATLAGELARHFAPYLSRTRMALEKLCRRYPKFLLAAMLVSITASGALSFKKNASSTGPVRHPLARGKTRRDGSMSPGALVAAGKALGQALAVKGEVDSLLEKGTLTGADSARLLTALGQLEKLNRKMQKP